MENNKKPTGNKRKGYNQSNQENKKLNKNQTDSNYLYDGNVSSLSKSNEDSTDVGALTNSALTKENIEENIQKLQEYINNLNDYLEKKINEREKVYIQNYIQNLQKYITNLIEYLEKNKKINQKKKVYIQKKLMKLIKIIKTLKQKN